MPFDIGGANKFKRQPPPPPPGVPWADPRQLGPMGIPPWVIERARAMKQQLGPGQAPPWTKERAKYRPQPSKFQVPPWAMGPTNPANPMRGGSAPPWMGQMAGGIDALGQRATGASQAIMQGVGDIGNALMDRYQPSWWGNGFMNMFRRK